MQENLRVSAGIPNVIDSSQWANLTTAAWCYYQNNPANGATYGKLYNWYAVNTGSLCPSGWHIPTDAEWQTLVDALGGDAVAGGAMKATTLWSSPNTGATNSSGFTALPGGYRLNDGSFYTVGGLGSFWSSTEYSSFNAWYRSLYYNYSDVSRTNHYKDYGFSCRCLRD